MKAELLVRSVGGVVVIASCIWVAGAAYSKYAAMWHRKQTAIAVRQFRANETAYLKLLESWKAIVPTPCGRPDPTQGFVTFEAVTRERDERLSVATSDGNHSNVSIDDAARLLDTKPQAVHSLIDTLSIVGSLEMLQSGAEVKIISPEDDTHGYLHIDQSCQEASTVAYWSQEAANFRSDNPGHFYGLESLGHDWYYYVEQR